MGYRFSNWHVCASSKLVAETVERVDATPCFLFESGGWTSVYPAKLEGSDASLTELTRAFSAALPVPVFAFEVYDSDVFRVELVHEGEVVDRFVSNPAGYNGGHSKPKGGDPDKFLAHCLPDTDRATLELLFKKARTRPPLDAEGREERKRAAKEIADAKVRMWRTKDPEDERIYAELSAAFKKKYPEIGFEDMPELAEELAVHLGERLGLDRPRVVNSWASISQHRENPSKVWRPDEVLDGGVRVVG